MDVMIDYIDQQNIIRCVVLEYPDAYPLTIEEIFNDKEISYGALDLRVFAVAILEGKKVVKRVWAEWAEDMEGC